jgi:hypothetical protein
MKLPLLIAVLLLSATPAPAFASKNYKGGYFEGENYVMTFFRIHQTDHKYSVSVIEPRSFKNENGDIVPSSFSFDCQNGRADGFVAMGADKPQAFIDDVLLYYLNEFCTRNGYEYEYEVD